MANDGWTDIDENDWKDVGSGPSSAHIPTEQEAAANPPKEPMPKPNMEESPLAPTAQPTHYLTREESNRGNAGAAEGVLGAATVLNPAAAIRGGLKSLAASQVGKYGGRAIGGLINGEQGAETGGRWGETAGAVVGPFISGKSFAKLPFGVGRIVATPEEYAAVQTEQKLAQRASDIKGGLRIPKLPAPKLPAPSLEQQANQIVERQLAVKAARVQAGLEPPAEENIAEVLRKEFLEPPKKSGVPQSILLPRAITPTYVPVGTPGAPAPAVIAPEIPSAPEIPPVSKLSEGPTALQHQVARQRALQDIRDATINRPGWVAKLPDRVTFGKLSSAEQRSAIQEAITNDPEASKAIRANARTGSAGDLAHWTQEDLWSRYMKEYKSPNPDEGLKTALKDEIARRGKVEAAPNQFRP